MKEYVSKKHPNFPPQLMTDEKDEQIKREHPEIRGRFNITEIKPMRSILPSAPIIEKIVVKKEEPKLEPEILPKEKKTTKKKTNE